MKCQSLFYREIRKRIMNLSSAVFAMLSHSVMKWLEVNKWTNLLIKRQPKIYCAANSNGLFYTFLIIINENT